MANINNQLILAILLVFLVLPLVQSAPPFYEVSEVGLSIRPPIIDSIKAGEGYEFNIHVLNNSDGLAITTASCAMHLYDINGLHISKQITSTITHFADYSFFVNGTNFTEGDYFVNFYCNTSSLGGDTAIAFKVTNSGYLPTVSESIIYFLLLFGLLFITTLVFVAHMGDKSVIWKFWWFCVTWILMTGITFTLWRISEEFISGQVFLSNMFHMLWLILMILFFPFILVLLIWTFFMLFVWMFMILPIKDRGFTTEEAYEQVLSRNKNKALGQFIKYADLFGGGKS